MIFLWILLALVLLVVLVLNTKVHLIFDCHEKFSVIIKILFFRFDAYKVFRKITSEKENSGNEASDSKKKSSTKSANAKKIDLFGFAQFLLHIGKVFTLAIKEHFSKASIYLKELNVKIGTDDAAETALITSTVMQAANGLFALLSNFTRFRFNNDKMLIAPDFTSEKSTVSFHLVMTSKCFDIIGVVLRSYIRFFERKEDNHARNSIKTGH